MRHSYRIGKNILKKIVITLFLILFFTSICCILLSNEGNISLAQPSSENILWDATLRITESGGAGIQVVFGEAVDASDAADQYDMPEPPFPPQIPFIRAAFITTMEAPYNTLLHDYKKYSDSYKSWDLEILFQPEPGNYSPTTITISWNPLELTRSNYTSISLLKNTTTISNMLTDTIYQFDSAAGVLHHFQIICQRVSSEQHKTPFVPILFILLLLILVTIYIYKKR